MEKRLWIMELAKTTVRRQQGFRPNPKARANRGTCRPGWGVKQFQIGDSRFQMGEDGWKPRAKGDLDCPIGASAGDMAAGREVRAALAGAPGGRG